MTTLEAVSGSFDFGRVVQRTFRVIGDNIALFAVSALVLVTLPVFAATVAGLIGGEVMFGVSTIAGALISMIGNFALQGLVVYAAIGKLNGRSIQIDEVVGVGVRFILPLFGLALLQALGIAIGTMLLIVPGLILMVMWSVATAALVIEKRGVFASLQRSRDLTRGNRWSIFGLLVVYFILNMLVAFITQALSMALGVTMAFGGTFAEPVPLTANVAIATFVSAVTNGLQAVLSAAGVAAIYYELRSAKEGVAPEQMAAVFD